MAAELIKEIYGIDTNSCSMAVASRWKQFPLIAWDMQLPDPHSSGKARNGPAGAGQQLHKGLFRRGTLLSWFLKMLRNLKTQWNLSILSLVIITRDVQVFTVTSICCTSPDFNWTVPLKDMLAGLESGSSPSHCSSEFLLKLADTFIILLTLKSSAVCSFTMQNMILPDKTLPLIRVRADQSRTENQRTDPINSSITGNALRCVALSESAWTVLSRSHKGRKEILHNYSGGKNEHIKTKSTIIPLNKTRINFKCNFSCMDCNRLKKKYLKRWDGSKILDSCPELSAQKELINTDDMTQL